MDKSRDYSINIKKIKGLQSKIKNRRVEMEIKYKGIKSETLTFN